MSHFLKIICEILHFARALKKLLLILAVWILHIRQGLQISKDT